MRRVFEYDVLECPRCRGRMKLIATITDPTAIAGSDSVRPGGLLYYLSVLPIRSDRLTAATSWPGVNGFVSSGSSGVTDIP